MFASKLEGIKWSSDPTHAATDREKRSEVRSRQEINLFLIQSDPKRRKGKVRSGARVRNEIK